MSNLKAALKCLLLALWIALCFAPVWISYKCRKYALRDTFMQISSIGMLKLIGVRVTQTGQLSDIRPLLLVSNHVSYLDVLILRAAAHVHFTPKLEIAGWPIINTVSRMSGGVFIDRRPEKVMEMKQGMIDSLAQGNVISLFPESTTGNGMRLLPFKSGFFSLAAEPIDGNQLNIQAAAITYTGIHSLPIDTTQWPLVAWYGDMDLLPHFWKLLKIAPVRAELVFLPPVTQSEQGDRKKLASYCYKAIDETIQDIRSRGPVCR